MITDPARPPAMEAWPAGTRRRALRHALRYRARQRKTDARVAALEAALRRALDEHAAGCQDWRRGLEEVLRG